MPNRYSVYTAWAWRVFCLVVLSVSLFILVLGVLLPRALEATPYTVLTGSMRPTYPPGTLVVVRGGEPEVGDVVTYQLESGKPTVVTHRVVGEGRRLGGGTAFLTRGDANEEVDPLVLPVQVRGVVAYHLPYVGFLSESLTGEQREGLARKLGYFLLLFACWEWGTWLFQRKSPIGKHRLVEPQKTIGDDFL